MALRKPLKTNKLDPSKPSQEIGACATRGGLITVDTPLDDDYFFRLHVGTGGDLLVRGKDNEIIPYLGLLSGQFVAAVGYEVVSAATIDGTPLTTTCTDITWEGGQ